LEIIALLLTVQHHSFHSSKFINSSNLISGYLFEKKTTISDFLLLRKENARLNKENTYLKNLLHSKSVAVDSTFQLVIDEERYYQQYQFSTAKIVNNTFRKRDNFITINKGSNHGLSEDLGVINAQGIIGVVKNVSRNYATVLSILNTNSRINVRLKNSDYFGTMIWDGKNYRTVQIEDLPRQAVLVQGDTIISGGRSAIFPEGIMIGTIADFKILNNQYENINVTLFNDMSSLSQVQVVRNLLKKEQQDLENKTLQNE
jgi:rod shape-determining protein MreC